MTKFIQLARRNMWRNWRQTLIATVAMVLGLILLIFMDTLMKGSGQPIILSSFMPVVFTLVSLYPAWVAACLEPVKSRHTL